MAKWQPKIDEGTAIEIARRECERRGWEWLERVRVRASPPDTWNIRTAVGKRGGNGAFMIDAHTGEVRYATFAGEPSI